MMWWQQVLLGAGVMTAVIGACYLLVWLLCRVPADQEQTVGVLEPELGWEAQGLATAEALRRHRAEQDAVNAASRVDPAFGDRVADRLGVTRPQPSFVVAARLVGGMGDGEEVEVHSQLWLAHPPTELHIRAVDKDATPPVTHRLLYRVSPEDSQVFVFAGVEPAPHEMMGDE